MTVRHFLSLTDVSGSELAGLVNRAIELKRARHGNERYEPMRGKTLAMLFDKSSTRTRVSFEVAMNQFGGSAIFLSPASTQLGRGEPVEDTARVMGRMVDAVVIRTYSHSMVETFAAHSDVPVINGLTDRFHPCQLLADIQTFQERLGSIAGRRVAWVGDGNNVCHSWINAARLCEFELHVATPPNYRPAADIVRSAGAFVCLTDDPVAAVTDADAVVTDTWASMGQEDEKDHRLASFAGYRVDTELMDRARPEAIFMHCLPAYREHEVTTEVLESDRSVVWDQAENRLHAQKALLEFLLA